MRPVIGILALTASVSLAAVSAAPALELPGYRFLEDSRWYVPPSTLPAVMHSPSTGLTIPVVDQTTWVIDDYRYGYFSGRAVTVLTTPDGKPIGGPQCTTMIGSVTPKGDVLISFVPAGDDDAEDAVTGRGTLERRGRTGRFTMQMATGDGALVAHWSYMVECRKGQACETKLPGSTLGFDAFAAQCEP